MSYIVSIHNIIIRTKTSERTLSLKHSDHLYKYIWGIIKNKKSVLYRINGVEDHLHLLASIHPTVALSDFVRDIKAESSKMLKRTEGFEKFRAWGEGYASLTYGIRDKNRIINYIKKQREHHKVVSFRKEYSDFIRDMGFEPDERHFDS